MGVPCAGVPYPGELAAGVCAIDTRGRDPTSDLASGAWDSRRKEAVS